MDSHRLIVYNNPIFKKEYVALIFIQAITKYIVTIFLFKFLEF